jgi:hypothetical protein
MNIHILSAVILATVAFRNTLYSQAPAPKDQPEPQAQTVAEPDPGIREIERKVLIKQIAAVAKELKEVEDAVMNATTPEQKTDASENAEKHRKWMDELKVLLVQAESGDNQGDGALTKRLDAIVIRYSAFRDATLGEVVNHLTNRAKEADPKKTGVPIRFSLMHKENEPAITFHLENATLHFLLQVVAEQAGLVLEIGEDVVSLRKQAGNKAEQGPWVQPAAQVIEDVAFFEKKYQKKITGVKPIGEYPDPDQFYSAIASQLGIPGIAWEAAAAKFGWKEGDGKVTKSMVKGGPVAGRAQGSWDVMFIRMAINPATKKLDPASVETRMVQIDYDGNVSFPDVK